MLAPALTSQFLELRNHPWRSESSNPNSMLLAPVKEQEIKIIIQSLNPKKAIGPYSIPTFLLKILSKYIAKPLSQIVNLSFEFGIFPDNLKIDKVNPLYKKDSAENPSNYRPISVLSVFSKIIESLYTIVCINSWKNLNYSIHCNLASEESIQLPMHFYPLQSQSNIP